MSAGYLLAFAVTVVTGARQARAVFLYSLVLALGVAVGMLAGGLIVGLDLLGWSWRAAFLVNLPVGAGLLVASGRYLPPDRDGERPRMDPVGVVTLSVATAAIVAPLVVGREQGWPVVPSVAVLVAGVLGLDGFRRYERWLARRGGAPLVELAVLRLPGVRAGLLACFLVMGCYTAVAFTMALAAIATVASVYFVAGGTGPVASAQGLMAALLIVAATLVVTAGLAGRAAAAISAAAPAGDGRAGAERATVGGERP
ncbi:MAG: hypothetical protein FWJ70_06715 [Micromonosporaceae bacterium]